MQTHRLYKTALLALSIGVVAACGGGGSSSGGGVEPGITYTGSYANGFYSGNITIQIPAGGRPIVTITGVECITGPFSEQITTQVNGNTRVVGGIISELAVPGRLSASFPDAGGEGTFFLGLSTDIGCKGSDEGTISVARS